jgi:hypothetical protein
MHGLISRPLALVGALVMPSIGQATTIDVLWTSGSTNYNANVTELAGEAPGYDPLGDGSLSWNVSFWDGSNVDFFAYDVLVIGSTYAVDQNFGSGTGGSTGYFGNGISAQGVLDNKDEISAARGDRTFLSGQDADWHDMNNKQDQDDGPKGFMINAVNWAASGDGLGIVSMVDRYYLGASGGIGWWDNPDSFLAEELGDDAFAFQSNQVFIGIGQDTFPINEGLSSAGLSGWSTSSHACFDDIFGFTRINFSQANDNGCGVTIVTSGQEGCGTTGPGSGSPNIVPLPAGMWLILTALAGIGILKRRGA